MIITGLIILCRKVITTQILQENFSQDPLLGAFFLLVVIAFLISPILGVIGVLITLKWYRSIKIKVQGKDKDATKRRKEALLRAKVFLLPYKDIWRNLTLSNKYCSLKLQLDGTTIIGTEKNMTHISHIEHSR